MSNVVIDTVVDNSRHGNGDIIDDADDDDEVDSHYDYIIDPSPSNNVTSSSSEGQVKVKTKRVTTGLSRDQSDVIAGDGHVAFKTIVSHHVSAFVTWTDDNGSVTCTTLVNQAVFLHSTLVQISLDKLGDTMCGAGAKLNSDLGPVVG